MSAWPWMAGVTQPIADPIDPVCPEDDRPSVKDLLRQHDANIAKIRTALAEEEEDPHLYDATKHDDLWILRFCLSHNGKVRPALRAARQTLQFRAQHGLDKEDIRHQYLGGPMPDGPVKEYLTVRCPKDSLLSTFPDRQRGIILFMKPCDFLRGASDHLTKNVWEQAYIISSEWTFQWLDYVTRTTGRLTKSIRFIDLAGIVSLRGFQTRQDMQWDGDIMGRMEDCYPQLLAAVKVCAMHQALYTLCGPWRAPSCPDGWWKSLTLSIPNTTSRNVKPCTDTLLQRHCPLSWVASTKLPWWNGAAAK